MQPRGLTKEHVSTALQVLEQREYLDDVIQPFGCAVPAAARLSSYAMTRYLTAYQPQAYAEAQRAIIAAIVNKSVHNDHDLVQETGLPYRLVHHVVDELEAQGELGPVSHGLSRTVFRSSPTLQRRLDPSSSTDV